MKAYLKIIQCEPGLPPETSNYVVIKDHKGRLIHGLFDKSNIKNNCLEVSVLGVAGKNIISVVSPEEFFNNSNIVYVKRSDLKNVV